MSARGPRLLKFAFLINHSKYNDAFAMAFGLIDAKANFTDVDGGQAWGVCPYDGAIIFTNDCYSLGEKVSTFWNSQLKGRANGAVVEMFVEPVRRALSFSVDGSERVEVGVSLPDLVRPYVRLGLEDDVVTLFEAQ